MIDTALLTATDFIGVRAGLVAALGNDANRAIVLTRIHWRSIGANRDAHEEEGHWWWRAKLQTVAEETGLSLDQVKRVVKWLVENGHIETREFRFNGVTDRVLSIRVITSNAESHSRSAESLFDSAESHSLGSAESHSLPSVKKEEVLSRKTKLPASWTPTAEHIALAKERGVDVDEEADMFRLHAEANDRHAVRWNAAFTMWLKKARPKVVAIRGPHVAPAPKLPDENETERRRLAAIEKSKTETIRPPIVSKLPIRSWRETGEADPWS